MTRRFMGALATARPLVRAIVATKHPAVKAARVRAAMPLARRVRPAARARILAALPGAAGRPLVKKAAIRAIRPLAAVARPGIKAMRTKALMNRFL